MDYMANHEVAHEIDIENTKLDYLERIAIALEALVKLKQKEMDLG